MIKAIVFDFGGVYMDSPFTALDAIARNNGIEPALLTRIVFGDYHLDNDHPWHCLERGEITLAQARERIIEEGKKYHVDSDIFVLMAQFAAVPRNLHQALVDKTLEWQQQGLKLGMITNNIREFDGWRKMFPFELETVFSTISDSSDLGIRKPNPSIYQHTLDALGVSAKEALFLDDYPANVAAAERLGIRSFQVKHSIEDAIHWVEQHIKTHSFS